MKPIDQLTDDEFQAQLGRALREMPDAPVALQEAAIRLFNAQPQTSALQHAAMALWRRVEAVLSFDSWATPALATGLRSVSAATRHLLFSIEGRDIDLRLSLQDGAYAIAGQVLGPDEVGEVELARGEPPQPALQTVALDEMGEFRFEGQPAGHCRLTLRLGGLEIVLPPVELGGELT